MTKKVLLIYCLLTFYSYRMKLVNIWLLLAAGLACCTYGFGASLGELSRSNPIGNHIIYSNSW